MKHQIHRTETFARFMHVVAASDNAPLRVQAVSDEGKLLTLKCTEPIYRRVLGTRRGEKGERFDLGLRKLTAVKFRGHFDADGLLHSLDIIPNRFFVSGAAPRVAGENSKKGFEIRWDEDLNGFDVWCEDPRTGDKVRTTYAGLAERELGILLDALRGATWKNRKSIELEKHRFERVEEGVFRCRPLEEVKYTT